MSYLALAHELQELRVRDVGYKRWPVFLEDGSFYFTGEKCNACDEPRDATNDICEVGCELLCLGCRLWFFKIMMAAKL